MRPRGPNAFATSEVDIDYRDHKAAFRLADLYWRRDDRDKCIEFLEQVCGATQRIKPRVELATYLQELERYAEARANLTRNYCRFKGCLVANWPKIQRRPNREG